MPAASASAPLLPGILPLVLCHLLTGHQHCSLHIDTAHTVELMLTHSGPPLIQWLWSAL
jgi:hypothetical protein